MGDVIPFRKKETVPPAVKKMLEIADEIDAVIVDQVVTGALDAKDMAGLLAHRLGTLMRCIPMEERRQLLQVCTEIAKRQADLSGAG